MDELNNDSRLFYKKNITIAPIKLNALEISRSSLSIEQFSTTVSIHRNFWNENNGIMRLIPKIENIKIYLPSDIHSCID